MKKIGILTFHWADDFGGMLQSYALKRFLTGNHIGEAHIIPYATVKLRARYWLIPYRPKMAGRQMTTQEVTRKSMHTLRMLPWKWWRIQKMKRFRTRYLTKHVGLLGSRGKIVDPSYDMIVLGSDQIWNPEITYGLDPMYFGAFPKRRGTVTVSYAASMGKAALTKEYEAQFQEWIRSVDVISVREESSVRYVQEQSGKMVQHMPDPTLLLSPKEWEEIAIDPKEKKYALLYYTEYNPALVERAVSYAKENQLTLISLNMPAQKYADMQVCYHIGPAEFLGYVKHASCVRFLLSVPHPAHSRTP